MAKYEHGYYIIEGTINGGKIYGKSKSSRTAKKMWESTAKRLTKANGFCIEFIYNRWCLKPFIVVIE